MADADNRERFSLRRWSQRKHAAARDAVAPTPTSPSPVAAQALPAAAAAPSVTPPPETPATRAAEAPAAEALPPVESLTFDADFTAFMKADVDPALRRTALKRLFSDPRFNVMDGLDVYIDDYTKFEPLDAETAKSLVSARYIFDPPKTRVTGQGVVEDVPPEETEAVAPPAEETPIALAADANPTVSGTCPTPDNSVGHVPDTTGREAVAREGDDEAPTS